MDDAKLRLCLLDRECSALLGDIIESDVGGSVRCGTCGAVSTTPPYLYTLEHRRVWLLDPDGTLGLRVPCSKKEGRHWHQGVYVRPGTCELWGPSNDPWRYVRAAWPLDRAPYRITDAIVSALNTGQDPGQAAFDVVAKTLLAEE